MIVRVVFRPYT
ncbi:unnamed protein product, partial [Onchocerca ochengi]|uniref:Uncharacterized protein n=1 Tax=Onchocerca ochengi TaxID=42157 RepID=A0A182E323_ONCOC